MSADVADMADCDAQHIGHINARPANDDASRDDPAARAHVGARATQTIPPSVRRAVIRRDQHRCRIPGCRNATFVDIHHIRARADDGDHHSDNLITLCGAHHRAAHRGKLVIDGTAGALLVRHADGRAYGQAIQPRSAEIRAKTFAALRGLGFREREIRTVLDTMTRDIELREASVERWLREALQRLTG